MRGGLPALALAAALAAPGATAGSASRYTVTIPSPNPALVRVRIELAQPVPAPATLVVPRAVPMGYGDVHYDRFVVDLRAFDGNGRSIESKRDSAMGVASAPRFIVGRDGERFAALEYDVDLGRMEREVRGAGDASLARPGFVGILGYTVFGFLQGIDGPIDLEVRAPDGWPVFLTLAPAVDRRGTVLATAPDFYALADSQILAGPALRLTRVASAVPLYVASFDEGGSVDDALARLGDEALRAVVEYFGKAPFDSYTIYEARVKPIPGDRDYDMGMEHLASMTSTRSLGEAPLETNRRRYFIAHHIAHAWIPKRCYGEGYFPFEWEFSPLIDTIWFSEGFAQYAAADALARPLPPKEGDALRERLVERRFRQTLREAPPSISRLSLADLSRIASSRYSDDFRLGMSAFARGGLMAAEVDAAIRKESGGRKDLRDALRGLVEWSRRERRAFSSDEIPGLIAQSTGIDVRAIFDRWKGAVPAF